MKLNPKHTDPPTGPGTSEFSPTPPTIEQQREHLAELLAHLLVRHWLKHGSANTAVSSNKSESVGDQTMASASTDDAGSQCL